MPVAEISVGPCGCCTGTGTGTGYLRCCGSLSPFCPPQVCADIALTGDCLPGFAGDLDGQHTLELGTGLGNGWVKVTDSGWLIELVPVPTDDQNTACTFKMFLTKAGQTWAVLEGGPTSFGTPGWSISMTMTQGGLPTFGDAPCVVAATVVEDACATGTGTGTGDCVSTDLCALVHPTLNLAVTDALGEATCLIDDQLFHGSGNGWTGAAHGGGGNSFQYAVVLSDPPTLQVQHSGTTETCHDCGAVTTNYVSYSCDPITGELVEVIFTAECAAGGTANITITNSAACA